MAGKFEQNIYLSVRKAILVLHDTCVASQYVTRPAKIDHVSVKKSPIFSVFAVS